MYFENYWASERERRFTKLLVRIEISVTSSPPHEFHSISLSKRLLGWHTKGPKNHLAMNLFSLWMCNLFSDKEPGNGLPRSLKNKEDAQGGWIYMSLFV